MAHSKYYYQLYRLVEAYEIERSIHAKNVACNRYSKRYNDTFFTLQTKYKILNEMLQSIRALENGDLF